MTEERKQRTFRTQAGRIVRVRPVSITKMDLVKAGALRELKAKGRPVDPPTYSVELAGGGTQKFPHDETTLMVRPENVGIADQAQAEAEAARQTAENLAAWEDHKRALAELRILRNQRSTRLILSGIDEEPPDDGWVSEHRALGIEVPDDPAERRYHWITTELLVTAADFMEATQAVTAESYEGLVPQEDIAAAMESFRGSLQGRGPGGASGGPLAVQPDPGSAAHGEGLGADAGGLEGGEPGGPDADAGPRPDMGPDGVKGAPGRGKPHGVKRLRAPKPGRTTAASA